MDQERVEIWELSEERESFVDDIRDEPDGMVQRAKDAVGGASDNPMLMLLGGLAIGFVVGMLLPMTRFERKNLGPVADDLKDRAREAIKDSIDAASEASRR